MAAQLSHRAGPLECQKDSHPRTVPLEDESRNFRCFLQDPVGVALFQQFLSQIGALDSLKFWFACEGMKSGAYRNHRRKLMRIIFRKFIRSGRVRVSLDTYWALKQSCESLSDCSHWSFDAAQAEVERFLQNCAHGEFTRSVFYARLLNETVRSQGPQSFSDRKKVNRKSSRPGIRDCALVSGRAFESKFSSHENADAKTFANLLIEKLKALKAEQIRQERVRSTHLLIEELAGLLRKLQLDPEC